MAGSWYHYFKVHGLVTHGSSPLHFRCLQRFVSRYSQLPGVGSCFLLSVAVY